jgi:Abnormal spindle-like microcephaly-assoc'd, ASPM-SPD-2-Hydin
VTPSSKSFGKVKVGSAKSATLTLVNQAKKGPPITFGVPITVISSSPQFSWVASTCAAQLLPRMKCKLTVEFRPTSTGPISSTLTILDNASNANQVVPLSGKGK